jgi:putative ABC transport system permease protein
LVFVLVGEAAGVCCILGAGNLGSELLYGVSPRDPMILGAVVGLLLAVSLVAALFPAWVTAGRNPNASLREI